MTPAQLRMARALLQLGMRELADKAGVNKMSIQRLESGRRAHPPTMGKIKSALIEMGIIFLGPVEPLHTETVALRWGVQPPAASEDHEAGEDDEDERSLEAQSWDEADAALDADQLAMMKEYWADPQKWAGMSEASRKALTKVMGQAPR